MISQRMFSLEVAELNAELKCTTSKMRNQLHICQARDQTRAFVVRVGVKSSLAWMMNKRKFGAGRGFPPRGKGLSSRSPPPDKRSKRDNAGDAIQGELVRYN